MNRPNTALGESEQRADHASAAAHPRHGRCFERGSYGKLGRIAGALGISAATTHRIAVRLGLLRMYGRVGFVCSCQRQSVAA